MSRIHSFRDNGERYPILRVVGTICTGLGFFLLALGGLCIVIGIAGLFTDLLRPYQGVGAGIALVWSFGLFVSGLQALAMGAFIRLAIHVEENTRATAQALAKLREAMEPKAEVEARSIFLS
jgi:hypothetical protein